MACIGLDTPTTSMSPSIPDSEWSEPQTSTAVQSKHLSSTSTTTLQTSTTLHDTPYEPLLPPISQDSRESSRRSRNSPIRTLPRRSTRAPSTLGEKDEFGILKEPIGGWSQVFMRRRARKLWWSRRFLEALMLIGSIYGTGRYLKAFTDYDAMTAQLATLGLGTSTGLSMAFTCCSVVLSFAQTRLLYHGLSVNALLSVRSALQYLASIFFVLPGIINLILLLVWRHTRDPELQLTQRCGLDIDLVWSVTSASCADHSRSWASWVALAAARIIISTTILVAFHRIASAQVIFLSNPPSIKAKQSHKRLHSEAEVLHSRSDSVIVPRLDRDSPALLTTPTRRQNVEATSLSNRSTRSRLRTHQSRSSEALSRYRSRLNDIDDAPATEANDFLPMGGLLHSRSNPGMGLGGSFMERFRALISQITSETERGLAFARSDSASASSLLSHDEATHSPATSLPDLDPEPRYQPQYSQHPHYDPLAEDDDFFSIGSPGGSQGDSYYQMLEHYRPEEHIPMMNGFIRKMPTIDSMGSREKDVMSLGTGGRNSLVAPSLVIPHHPSPLGTPNNTGSRSRSPTKNASSPNNTDADSSMDLADALQTLDFSGSGRRKSLTAQAEILAGLSDNEGTAWITNKVGEQGETVRMMAGGSSAIMEDSYALDSLRMKLGGFNQDIDLALGFGFNSSTSGSKESKESENSMQTFHTAKSVEPGF